MKLRPTLILVGGVALLSACSTTGPSTQISELDEARMWIEKARNAGAETCTPALQAKAVARLHHAAHEFDEKHYHPDENARLAADAVKYAKQAYEKTQNTCNKPKVVVKAAPKVPPRVAPSPAKPPAVIALNGVFFETNSAELKPASRVTLDAAVKTLRDHPELRVEVAAHTDSRGRASYNLKLSDKRANSVMAYLISHGIDASRLQAKGYGEAMPIADNATEEGRAKNRRVELRPLP